MAEINPLEPHVEENFFTAEEYKSIYETIQRTMELGAKEAGNEWHHFKKNTNNGFNVIFLSERRNGPLPGLSKMVEDKIRQKFEEKAVAEVGHIGILWARYTLESGDIPSLIPHQDRSETHAAYTFTVELEKNIDAWDFYVEDQKFEMNKNQAIWFSGTHQSHWRPDKEFKKGDYYDIILCQTHHPDDENQLSEEFFLDGDDHSIDIGEKYKDLLKNTLEKTQRIYGACQ